MKIKSSGSFYDPSVEEKFEKSEHVQCPKCKGTHFLVMESVLGGIKLFCTHCSEVYRISDYSKTEGVT